MVSTKPINHFFNSSGINLEEFNDIKNVVTIRELINVLDSQIKELDEASHEVVDGNAGSTQKIELLKSLKKTLVSTFPDTDPDPVKVVSCILEKRLPKFLYFAEYQKMPGQVAINEIRKKSNENRLDQSDKIFLALLDLAGSSIDEIDKAGKYEELKAELEGVSSRISDEIFEYWTQNKHLNVKFEFDNARPADPVPYNSGYIFRTRIENIRHRVTVNFDDRSTGFVWFFSFLVWFSQVRKNFGDNLIILLDEPALNLHAKAQSDLLRYIEEQLKPYHQVIYTTHSPFMIDPNNILSSRTVEDKVTDNGIEGTKVGDHVFSTDADTLFPLQRVLGYEISQTLFIGKNTLLVEGPSDVLYLKWFSQLLQHKGKEHLDPKWVITPSGGADKMMSFIKLFGANMLNIVALLDFSEGQKKKINRFRESGYISKDRILTAEMFTRGKEADIEDIMGRPFYVSLVNECYNLTENNALPNEKPADAKDRILIEIENHMVNIAKISDFNHYKPSEFLTESGQECIDKFAGVEDAIKNFEKLFMDINRFLRA